MSFSTFQASTTELVNSYIGSISSGYTNLLFEWFPTLALFLGISIFIGIGIFVVKKFFYF